MAYESLKNIDFTGLLVLTATTPYILIMFTRALRSTYTEHRIFPYKSRVSRESEKFLKSRILP